MQINDRPEEASHDLIMTVNAPSIFHFQVMFTEGYLETTGRSTSTKCLRNVDNCVSPMKTCFTIGLILHIANVKCNTKEKDEENIGNR